MHRALHAWRVFEYSYKLLLNDICDHLESFYSSFIEYLKDTVEHLTIALILYIIICITLYLCIMKWKYFTFNRDIRNSKRVLFVIAHPDDECMFFGPTILNYTRKEDCEVYLLCLSTGNSYGKGTERKKELYKSCEVLGIKEGNIVIRTHTNLPDAMDVRWPTELISNLILNQVDTLNITTLITFDRDGVSYHSNHCSIYYAVANLILDGDLPKCCGVFVLESVNILRKYWLLLDIPLSFIFSRIRYMGDFDDRSIVQKAMHQHRSQLVWYRRIYTHFSRYLLMNSLQQVNLVDIELDLEMEMEDGR